MARLLRVQVLALRCEKVFLVHLPEAKVSSSLR